MEIINPSREKKGIIVYGASEAGIIAKRVIETDIRARSKVIAFIDDDPRKNAKKLEGINIYTFDKLETLTNTKDIAQVVIAIPNLEVQKKQAVVDICVQKKIHVLYVPPVSNWINGKLSFSQIKKIRIEDLLQRDEIKLDKEGIKKYILNKTIMITGAAGSIGIELARQVAAFSPKLLILLDQAESAMFYLDMEFSEKFRHIPYKAIIGSINDAKRIDDILIKYKPEVVFHAAAYKHVPLMEKNPYEAVKTNIFGTKILAEAAIKHKVEKFIFISTDKAVNPTNVMGASKRIAEIYIRLMNNQAKTLFITTRFGNVLGSEGSVIPLFEKQIEQGGPVKVTHPEVTRYFMTIPEASQLVLEAAAMGSGGEIFIFDMGDPVKILDLAKKMIQLSGFNPEHDIQVTFIGLRQGEKLYEELLANQDNTIPTHHHLILKSRVKDVNHNDFFQKLDIFYSALHSEDPFAIVKKMKELVPEFISKNSRFEKLDS